MKIETLYERLGGKIYRYLCLKLQSSADAEDVMQEVFCRLVRYRVRIGLLKKPGAFVMTIARNEANRFMARKSRERNGNQKTAVKEVLAHVLEESESGRLSRLASVFERIPPEQRDVIFLKVFEDLTFREIASLCGISPDTAASRYRYGIEKAGRIMGRKHENKQQTG